jgi:hypothetical protein
MSQSGTMRWIVLCSMSLLLAACTSPDVVQNPTPVAGSPAPAAAMTLEQVVFQPGDLPADFAAGRISTNPPNEFRDAPPAAEVARVSLNFQGLNSGDATVLRYESTEARDQAFEQVAAAKQQVQPQAAPPPEPVGERALLVPGGLIQGVNNNTYMSNSTEILFARCGVLALVRLNLEMPERDELVTNYARQLDGRLAPLVCE